MLRIMSVICGILLSVNLAWTQSNISTWFLPQEISEVNTTVDFEMDTTWHLLEGKVKNFKGEAKLVDLSDPTSLSVNISFPVKSMDTDNSSRDEKMRKVMAEDRYSTVVFTADKLLKNCTPAQVMSAGSCNDEMQGKLKIRSIEKSVLVPVKIMKDEKGFIVEGQYSLKWAEYEVEDPSIIIARVDPTVTVKFLVKVNNKEI